MGYCNIINNTIGIPRLFEIDVLCVLKLSKITLGCKSTCGTGICSNDIELTLVFIVVLYLSNKIYKVFVISILRNELECYTETGLNVFVS